LRINEVSIYLFIATDFPEQEDKDDSDTQESDRSVISSGNLMFG